MADTFRLYDLSDSPFCLKARIFLNLKKVPYRRVTLTVRRLPELRRLNILGKVPVLVANGRAVPDSSQIAQVLEEQFPKPPLLPKDAAARAYCHLLEEWADEPLYWIIGAFKWLNPRNRSKAYAATAEMAAAFIPPPLLGFLVRNTMVRRYRAWGYTARVLPHLETRMKENLTCLDQLLSDKAFLLGKYITLADIAVYSQLAWMRRYEERRLLESFATVQKWMGRLDEVEEIQAASATNQESAMSSC